MVKILSNSQLQEADAMTIGREPITSLDLMERAGNRCYDWLFANAPERLFPRDAQESEWRFAVFCGMGNNGGDGLVIARLLARNGYEVRAILLRHRKEASSDNLENQKRLKKARVELVEIDAIQQFPVLEPGEVVVDALFGSGLSRPLEGTAADLVKYINASGNMVVSIDMPSGLAAEDVASGQVMVKSDHTLVFESPRLALMYRENEAFVGEWATLPIGLDPQYMQETVTPYVISEERDVRSMLRPRPRAGHKGDFGHALLVAGAAGTTGAAVLAARACVRSGAGLCTVHTPATLHDAMLAAVPEVMHTRHEGGDHLSTLPPMDRYTALGVGPGMGMHPGTATMFKMIIQEHRGPMVLDADAINLLAENKTWIEYLSTGCILTPHPKEFDRLSGTSANSSERLEKARQFAIRSKSVVVLKGWHTAVCDPMGMVYFNPTGNAGMAKGGSGDALTGLLTGLLAQGIEPLQAALLGVYVHGLAGDLAATALGQDGMIVSDLIAELPRAFQQLRRSPR